MNAKEIDTIARKFSNAAAKWRNTKVIITFDGQAKKVTAANGAGRGLFASAACETLDDAKAIFARIVELRPETGIRSVSLHVVGPMPTFAQTFKKARRRGII